MRAEIEDLVVMARTVWGEASGEPLLGQQAVAWVIRNRWAGRYGGARSIATICQAPWQFSCWNDADPNRDKLLAVDGGNRAFCRALSVVGEVMAGDVPDPTDGARHYHHHAVAPRWSAGHQPSAIIGNHLFFNEID